MGYATQQDLVDRIGETELLQLADRDRDGEIDTAVVAEALADADREIDSYVGRRYALPLSSQPPILKRVACCLARLFLSKDAPREAVKTDAEWARSWLADVSIGKAVLEADGSEQPSSGGGNAEISAPDRTFSRDSLRGY